MFGRIRRWYTFQGINRWYVGLKDAHCRKKVRLLRAYGFSIGDGTRVVGPVSIDGKVCIGTDVFVGKDFAVCGNGKVTIGDRCDIAPRVCFLTGTHEIGDSHRRAGKGKTLDTVVGSGTWIGAGSLILPGITIGSGCVIAAGSVVTTDVPDNALCAGVPAKVKKQLSDGESL